jgi:transglutaminase-like putative cysteine protease
MYHYAQPVRFGQHRLVLRPREGHDLRVERMDLRLEPGHHLQWTSDVFGNSIGLVDWLAPAQVLTIVNDVIVERIAPPSDRDRRASRPLLVPIAYGPLEAALLRGCELPLFPEDNDYVTGWLKTLGQASGLEDRLRGLCRLVFETVRYRRRLDSGVQPPALTLRLATGSCRDMATLMMEAARLLGVAARFASGYLHGSASVAGRASMHAWTEVYLPTIGWKGFDPTLGEAVSLKHIVTGVSSHPRGVMPVTGTFVGARTDFLGMDVSVRTEELNPSCS